MQDEKDRDKIVADAIKSGKCPFGMLEEGQTMGQCPSGFPGCGCADEKMLNPHLCDEWEKMIAEYNPQESTEIDDDNF